MVSGASEHSIDFEALRLLCAFFPINNSEGRRAVVDLAEEIAHEIMPLVRAFDARAR